MKNLSPTLGWSFIAAGILASNAVAQNPNANFRLSTGNRLSYLDEKNPFYPDAQFPALVTPQWIGESNVQAVVILAVDDMLETKRYEIFLRPILERLKKIDGRAPVSIMTEAIPANDPLAQIWLKEGLSLEVHTIKHPCPLLADGDFNSAAETYFSGIDLMNKIPGNKPVAFRMPCCDSMNSPSPRFYAEIFNRPSPDGNFLTIDTSVMNIFTTNDAKLPRDLTTDANGRARFRKYFPSQTNATTRISLEAFATTIENYPYPYVIGKLCWEFPCAAPSDWEAHNFHGSTNETTIADWKAGIDNTMIKQGVFTMVFHPHGWIRAEQMIDLIDYAQKKYGDKIKFLTFREAQERLDKNLLSGQPLRAAKGEDNGVRLLDLNNDGFMDVVIGNEQVRKTRLWNPSENRWSETGFPIALVSRDPTGNTRDRGVKCGIVQTNHLVTAFYRDEKSKGAWHFDGQQWKEDAGFFAGLNVKAQPIFTTQNGRDAGVRLCDVDNDGRCELLVGNETQNAIFSWSDAEKSWKKLSFALPAGTSIVNSAGEDNGLRFVDLNEDGYDDVIFSNESEYSVHLFIARARPNLGWEAGWSYRVRSGKHGEPGGLPAFVRSGPHRDNGAWFHAKQLFVQNEYTSNLPARVERQSFKEILSGAEAKPKSPAEALSSFRVAPGFKIELVASEPLVVDPVHFDWGADGKLWVVEMRDYPLGLDGKGKPGGVVRFLEDTNGDGQYDKSTVFLENLNFPNSIMPWSKGVLICAAPDIIYAEDTNSDGKADVRKVLFSGFAEINQQHRFNGFQLGLDNWIYAAADGGGKIHSALTGKTTEIVGHDVRFRPDTGEMEPVAGTTQYGRRRDDWGNWFGNHNGIWIWHFIYEDRYLARNPFLGVKDSRNILPHSPDPNRVFSVSRPQQRFNWPDRIFQVTSACSVTPYRDELFGPDFTTSAFVSEPANNAVHREVLEQDGPTFISHRAATEQTNEFLASTDNWFRPTMLKVGPDGALYIADMYRLVLEHPEYFPTELKNRPDLRAGDDKGRIYRVYPEGAQLRKIPRLDKLNTAELVAALDSPNGWQRDTIQRLLVQARDKAAITPLQQILSHSENPKARLQALSILSGLDALSEKDLLTAMNDSHFAVRRLAIQFAETLFGESPELDAKVLTMVDDDNIRVRYQLAFSLGESSEAAAARALSKLALKDWTNAPMQIAVMSSATHHVDEMLRSVFANSKTATPSPDLIEQLVFLATALSHDGILAETISHLGTPVNGTRFSQWQISGTLGFLDALERRKLSLAKFQEQADFKLNNSIAQLDAIFVQARETADNSSAAEADRLLAVRLLGRRTNENDLEHLGKLLGPQNSPALQHAALQSIVTGGRKGAAEILMANLKTYGLSLRQEILNSLLGRSEWSESVLAGIETGKIASGDVSLAQRQKLLSHSKAEIRERAEKIFSAVNSDRAKIIENYKSVAALRGDIAKGHALFLQTCATCHQLNGEGHPVGPNLGTMADKTVQSIVVALLDPNQAVDPTFAAYSIVTKDERELSGVIAAETPTSISLKIPGGSEEVVLRNNIKGLNRLSRSLMPEGFETALKPQDMADLISYVLNARR